MSVITVDRQARTRPLVMLLLTIIAQTIFCEFFTHSWIAAFIKAGPQYVYPLIYFSLLFCSLVAVLPRIQKCSVVVALLLGVILGQLVAMISIMVYGLLLPDGFTRFVNSIRLGTMNHFLVTGCGALVLGGWLFGGISSVLMQLMSKHPKK